MLCRKQTLIIDEIIIFMMILDKQYKADGNLHTKAYWTAI